MAGDDAPAAEAFGAGGADIILGHDLLQGAAGKFGHHGQGTDAQGKGGQDEIFQLDVFTASEIVDCIKAAGHVQPGEIPQHEGKEPGDEDGGEEGGQ